MATVNTFMTTLNIEELTEQLLKKATDLGRTPSSNEVKADPDMASIDTFVRAFGMSWE